MQRNRIFIGIIVIVIIAIGLFITEPWTYFIVNEVDEAFPGLNTQETEVADNTPDEEQDTTITPEEVTPVPIDDDNTVSDEEQTTSAEPVVLQSGSFITIDPVHGAEGTATIYELPEGNRVLRFEDFESTNGPELHVILSKEIPTTTFAGVGEDMIDLGELKGNVGNQNYDIPADLDLNDYKSVVIYCVPFKVVFSSADLSG